MAWLITGDLHLTNRGRDSHRLDIFRWLGEESTRYDVDTIIILGDLTDQKDGHPAELVNAIVDDLRELSARGVSVYILRGNHDYIDADCPFFLFLNELRGRCCFINKITEIELDGASCLFLPHTASWWGDWIKGDVLSKNNERSWDYVFCHQAFTGALSESGHKLEDGAPRVVLSSKRTGGARVLAGDLHVPQCVGDVEYVGAPYPIKFGDSFTPRVILVRDDWSEVDLIPPFVRKVHARIVDADDLRELEIDEGDQVRVTVGLTKAQFIDWEQVKQSVRDVCKELGVVLCGVEMREIKRRRLKDATDSGEEHQDASATKEPGLLLKLWAGQQSEKLSKKTIKTGEQLLKG